MEPSPSDSTQTEVSAEAVDSKEETSGIASNIHQDKEGDVKDKVQDAEKTFVPARLVAEVPSTMKPEHRELRLEKQDYRWVCCLFVVFTSVLQDGEESAGRSLHQGYQRVQATCSVQVGAKVRRRYRCAEVAH